MPSSTNRVLLNWFDLKVRSERGGEKRESKGGLLRSEWRTKRTGVTGQQIDIFHLTSTLPITKPDTLKRTQKLFWPSMLKGARCYILDLFSLKRFCFNSQCEMWSKTSSVTVNIMNTCMSFGKYQWIWSGAQTEGKVNQRLCFHTRWRVSTDCKYEFVLVEHIGIKMSLGELKMFYLELEIHTRWKKAKTRRDLVYYQL